MSTQPASVAKLFTELKNAEASLEATIDWLEANEADPTVLVRVTKDGTQHSHPAPECLERIMRARVAQFVNENLPSFLDEVEEKYLEARAAFVAEIKTVEVVDAPALQLGEKMLSAKAKREERAAKQEQPQ